jgi:ribosomal protein L7Ae-like RNA K-turn-binding protein
MTATTEEQTKTMDPVLERRLLGLVGLGVRSRGAVVGVESVRDAAKKGRLELAIVALDVSRHSLDKVMPLLEARRVPIIHGPSAASLGAAVGKETTAAVGIIDRALADGLRALFEPRAPQGRNASSHRAR